MMKSETVVQRILPFLFLAATLLFAAPATAASPSDALRKHAPKSAKVLMAVNVPAVRSSFLFQDMLDFIRKQPANQDVLGFVLQSGFVDIEKDVQAMMVATPTATVPSQPGQPVPKQDVALLVNGKLDMKKAVATAKSKYGKLTETKRGERTIWDTGSFKFTFVDDKTMVLVAASEPYESATWKALDDPKASIASDKAMNSVLKRIKTSAGIWMATTESPSPSGGMPAAPVENFAMDLDIAGRMMVNFKSESKDKAGAKQMADQLKALKNESAQSPMVQALGAGPLLANLKVTQNAKRVDISTRMTESEFKSMFERIKALQGGAGAPAPPQTPAGSAPTPEKKPQGADADFN